MKISRRPVFNAILPPPALLLGGAMLTICLCGAAGNAVAQDLEAAQENEEKAENAPPAKLDFTQFPGALVEKIVVPVPAEIFAVLDKLAEPNWKAQIRLPEENRSESDRLRLALIFGATVGEGFIAVEAEETDPIQRIGRRVLRLADALSLQDAVVPHCQSIIDNAGTRDWRTVREELDRTQQTVCDTMEELHDDELASLVSLGGWLRGTQAITTLISEAYSLDKAELLNQPDLVSHFYDTVTGMDEKTRTHADIDAVTNGLGEILEALSEAEGDESDDPSGGVVSAATVKRIGEVCDDLLQRFYLEPDSKAASDKDPAQN